MPLFPLGQLSPNHPPALHHSRQLLGELLLDGINVRLMMRYVSDARNLMLMMNLLKDSSRSIQFEAFHVFKVGGGRRAAAVDGDRPPCARG